MIAIWQCTAICFFFFFFLYVECFADDLVCTIPGKRCLYFSLYVFCEQGAPISLFSVVCAMSYGSSIFDMLAYEACFAYWFHKCVIGPVFVIFTDLEMNLLFLYSYCQLSISGTNAPHRLTFHMPEAVNEP